MIKTKIRHLLVFHRLLALTALAFLILLSVRSPLDAQTVTQGYGADSVMQRGMIVGIKEEDTSKVTPLTLETAEKMHGVVVDANDSPVTLSEDGQKVFVANIGKYDVLVTDQNGPIRPGDFITVSSIAGLGMKVDDKAPTVIGKALVGFDGNGGFGTAKVGEKTVNITRIAADIAVSRNPLQKASKAILPEFLRSAAETIAGKPVPIIRVYIGMIIFIISTIVSGSLLYSGVRSSIISIGRNPLSKKSIIRGMFQVVLVGLIIFICGIFGVYLLLKL